MSKLNKLLLFGLSLAGAFSIQQSINADTLYNGSGTGFSTGGSGGWGSSEWSIGDGSGYLGGTFSDVKDFGYNFDYGHSASVLLYGSGYNGPNKTFTVPNGYKFVYMRKTSGTYNLAQGPNAADFMPGAIPRWAQKIPFVHMSFDFGGAGGNPKMMEFLNSKATGYGGYKMDGDNVIDIVAVHNPVTTHEESKKTVQVDSYYEDPDGKNHQQKDADQRNQSAETKYNYQNNWTSPYPYRITTPKNNMGEYRRNMYVITQEITKTVTKVDGQVTNTTYSNGPYKTYIMRFRYNVTAPNIQKDMYAPANINGRNDKHSSNDYKSAVKTAGYDPSTFNNGDLWLDITRNNGNDSKNDIVTTLDDNSKSPFSLKWKSYKYGMWRTNFVNSTNDVTNFNSYSRSSNLNYDSGETGIHDISLTNDTTDQFAFGDKATAGTADSKSSIGKVGGGETNGSGSIDVKGDKNTTENFYLRSVSQGSHWLSSGNNGKGGIVVNYNLGKNMKYGVTFEGSYGTSGIKAPHVVENNLYTGTRSISVKQPLVIGDFFTSTTAGNGTTDANTNEH